LHVFYHLGHDSSLYVDLEALVVHSCGHAGK
jgi:hypothetical protein